MRPPSSATCLSSTRWECERRSRPSRNLLPSPPPSNLSCLPADQLISDKKVLTERCEGVLAELKQVDQMYSKKISQMEEQNEMVRRHECFHICDELQLLPATQR